MSLHSKRYGIVCQSCGFQFEGHYNDNCPQCKELTPTKIVYRLGVCDCGEEIEFGRFTNTCHECGRDYNSAGDELAPRWQWGEETGESVSDILMIDSLSTEELLD